MGNELSTLKKLEFANIEQFLQDINQQFAIIQNSPLFKGIPGNSVKGDRGDTGKRGAIFFFVEQLFTDLQTEFIQINQKTDITLNLLNLLINDFDNNQKLLNIFNVESLVKGDVIVLHDTLMLSYDENNNLFINTGVYFNEETNLLTNLEQTVAGLIALALENLNVSIISKFDTLGKNYSDNNSTNISNEILDVTAFSPYIEGFNSKSGPEIDNHKFYSFTNLDESLNDTTVIGNLKTYYRMLHKTITNAIDQNFNSDYVPGIGNIPKIIMMQNDTNNGFYFGHGGDDNLFNFASIFKDKDNRVVLKSHSSPLPNEYSYFSMGIGEFYYNKNIRIDGEFLGPIARIDNIFNHENLYAGAFGDNNSTSIDDWNLIIYDNFTILNGDNIKLSKFINQSKRTVLTTDSTGYLQKTYTIADSNNFENIDNNDIITGIQFNSLVNFTQNLDDILTNDYYSIDDWSNNGIGDLTFHGNTFLVKQNNFSIFKDTIRLGNQSNWDILSTDVNGILINKFRVYNNSNFIVTENNDIVTFDYTDTNIQDSIVETRMLKKVTDKFNSLTNKLFNYLGDLKIKSLSVDSAITTVKTNVTHILNGEVQLNNYSNFKMLSTDINGKITNNYVIPQDYIRSNTTSGLVDAIYMENFIDDYAVYNYDNLPENVILSGKQGNFFMQLFRILSGKITSGGDAFDREAKFIVGKFITDNQLVGTNWWVADGTNNTDDMMGRYVLGGRAGSVPYVGNVGQNNQTLSIDNVPEHRHRIKLYRAGVNRDDIDGDSSAYVQNDRTPRADGSSMPRGIRNRNGADIDIYTEFTGNINNTESFDNRPASILGTWIQYVKPDVSPPTAPTALIKTNITSSSFRLTWFGATDDKEVASYKIYIDGVFYASTTGTFYNVIGRNSETLYNVSVSAIDTSNKESTLKSITVTTLAGDNNPPTIPSQLLILSRSQVDVSTNLHNITIQFNSSTDDVVLSPTYIVESKLSTSSLWQLKDTFSSPIINNKVSRVLRFNGQVGTLGSTLINLTYEVRVRSIDASGNSSGYSNQIAFTLTPEYISGSGGGSGGPLVPV